MNPPLTGKESWSELDTRAWEAAGKIGGSELGGAIAGPAGTFIGGVGGAILGGQVADWINDNAQGVYDWCKAKLGGAWDWVEGEAGDIYNSTLGQIF